MSIKKVVFKSLLLLILITMLTTQSYSQESLPKELKWKHNDSITETIFQDTNKIIKWGTNFSAPHSFRTENLYIRNYHIFILMVDICSGVYCPDISVFKKENNKWRLITSTRANSTEYIGIEVDNEQKIIFKTKSRQIGELPFEVFTLNSDNSPQ